MRNEMAMYVLSAVILALGAVSLFTQKFYKVDKETGTQIEVELPMLGKLKTNYPALAFGFIGAGLAAFTFQKSCELTDRWVITGKLNAPESTTVYWGNGALMLAPAMLKPNINPDGTFEIEGTIKRGVQFEDVVDQITYCNWCTSYYSARIMTREEYGKYKAGQPSKLRSIGPTMRTYGPLQVDFTSRN